MLMYSTCLVSVVVIWGAVDDGLEERGGECGWVTDRVFRCLGNGRDGGVCVVGIGFGIVSFGCEWVMFVLCSDVLFMLVCTIYQIFTNSHNPSQKCIPVYLPNPSPSSSSPSPHKPDSDHQ